MTDLQVGFYLGLFIGVATTLIGVMVYIVSRNLYRAYEKQKEEERFQWLRRNPPHWDGKGGCWR